MPVITAQQAGGANRCAFLDMVAWSEGTSRIPGSDDGYRVLVGATPDKPLTFASYAAHPDILNRALNSTAAGRYQLLYRYWLAYRTSLRLTDFSPLSQDRIALQQIREKGALTLIDAGSFTKAVQLCSGIWASLPGNDYGQHVNTITALQTAYVNAGGALLGGPTSFA
ncbi:glycoside hydrolase family 104 protein [Burkholderia multivorans]|uniref:glycoside hydrolase family 24 protein n=1 Tax=Burkholderia multivorans TaxID=87883 RepID=UPI001C22E1D9|nr:glycoside hydrolase family 104 protein [Burkholderia multivorans]MBU9608259.1 glycoside hydrolase family 104 protein [Burkholderia multivorans]MCA8248065.1 glycoside hydrolase family 104 protein [Burkholderia multivorans]